MVGNAPLWHQLLHLAHHQIDDVAFQPMHVTHRGDDDVWHVNGSQRLLDSRGKVFEHDQRFGARVI